MNHSCKIGRNHESSCLKLGNHEQREMAKRIIITNEYASIDIGGV